MNIIQATAAALEKGCCIQREENKFLKLKPTKLCYEVVGSHSKYGERPQFWDSQTEDVLADDWILID